MEPAVGVLLLVEDNEDDALLIQETLYDSKLAKTILVVKDGEEAILFLRREGKFRDAPVPGLVLLDIKIPKKDGFTVLKEIKSKAALKHIPVIILTASDKESDIARSYAKGACSYITKPASYDKFCDLMGHFVFYWRDVARIPPVRKPTRAAAADEAEGGA